MGASVNCEMGGGGGDLELYHYWLSSHSVSLLIYI